MGPDSNSGPNYNAEGLYEPTKRQQASADHSGTRRGQFSPVYVTHHGFVEGSSEPAMAITTRTCVYCGVASDLTNEHVIPECFQKTFEPITTAKTPTGEKAILSALEIHDVCARRLSSLLLRRKRQSSSSLARCCRSPSSTGITLNSTAVNRLPFEQRVTSGTS